MEGLIRLFPLITSLLPAIVVCVLLPIILLRKARLRSKMPPGPHPWPIIGHLHLLGNNPHHSLHNLSKIHGPLMSLRLGSVAVIVASTADMAQQILQTHDQTFSAHPQLAVPTHLHGCSDILFAPPGPHWNFMRRLCMNELFSKKRLEFFRPVRTAEVGALMRSILIAKGKPIALRAELHAVATNIISRMALGKRLSELATTSQADPSHNIVALTIEMNDLLGTFNVSDFIPSLAWMDLQGCARRSKDVARKLNIVLQEVIDGRRDGRHGSDGSMLEVLLLASRDTTQKNIQITDHKVKAVLMNMFGGGIDTSSITIEWALAELFANPTKMRMVEEELGRVVGTTRLVQESDIPHLLYLQAVVKETMRLHPVLPLLVPHISSQPCQISGYQIPANTLAFVNVWAIGRDANTWEKPLEFCPERFLDSNMDVNGQHFELLPFGSGRKGCPGWTLGLLTVQIILASLLHSFNWTTIEKLDILEKCGLISTLSNPLMAKATPKLSPHLFEAQK